MSTRLGKAARTLLVPKKYRVKNGQIDVETTHPRVVKRKASLLCSRIGPSGHKPGSGKGTTLYASNGGRSILAKGKLRNNIKHEAGDIGENFLLKRPRAQWHKTICAPVSYAKKSSPFHH